MSDIMLNNFQLFTDRAYVSSLPDGLRSHMKRQGLISASDIKIHFCGVVTYLNGIAVFMPRNTDLTGIEKSKPAAASLVFAMSRYFRERGTEIYSCELGEGAYGDAQLGLFLALLEDYSLNGLYSLRVTERTVNIGKTDWRRTINRSRSFPGKGGPVYIDMFGSRRRYLSACETAQIHARVIRELDSVLGWAITGDDSLIDETLLRTPLPVGGTEYQITVLESAFNSAYSDRDIFLIGSLLNYLRNKRGNDLSDQVIGLRHFHGMWEHMLDNCLKWTRSVNQYIAVPVYRIKGVYQAAARKGQRTDTVLKHPKNNVFTVVDAKYYEASGLNSSPGWPDLVKQFYYAKALKQVHEEAIVLNAFIFPGKEGPVESAHMAERGKGEVIEDDLLEDEYPSIRCIYQDPLELLECYVKGRKLIGLSSDLLFTYDKKFIAD